eukprot:s3817_g6.t1
MKRELELHSCYFNWYSTDENCSPYFLIQQRLKRLLDMRSRKPRFWNAGAAFKDDPEEEPFAHLRRPTRFKQFGDDSSSFTWLRPPDGSQKCAKILRGSLDFSTLTAQSIMVPMTECFCLDANAVINPGLCAAVAAAGFSRVPVIDRDPLNPKKQFAVVGLFHVKDLLLLEIDQDVPLKALLPLIGREVLVVDDDRPLPELLEEFRRGASQLAVVRGIVDDEDCDPYFRHVGILTLQDLLNTIVQDDVHEVDADDKDSEVSSEPSGMFSNVRRFHESLDQSTGQSHQGPLARAQKVQVARPLSNDEVIASAAFLRLGFRIICMHICTCIHTDRYAHVRACACACA